MTKSRASADRVPAPGRKAQARSRPAGVGKRLLPRGGDAAGGVAKPRSSRDAGAQGRRSDRRCRATVGAAQDLVTASRSADSYAAVFTALAHPARRLVLMTLNFEGGSMTAGAIADVFEHSWPTTTRHLRVLEAAGLIRHERRGRRRIYRIDKQRIALVRDWLQWFFKPAG